MIDRVTLELEGLMLEKLLDRSIADGARFAAITRISRRRISVCTDAKSARVLRRLAEKYHIPCRTAHTGGVSAFKAALRARCTVAAAFFTAILLSTAYLSRIWVIDVDTVNGAELPTGIYHALESAGISYGAYIHSADTALAALRIAALDGCANAAVQRKGVAVKADIACEESAPETYDIGDARDLLAARDGVISSVTVVSGTAMVSPGDTVRRGQVLISGYERSAADDWHDVGALGSVTAHTWHEGEASAPLLDTRRRYTGRSSVSVHLSSPWFEIPLVEGERFILYDEQLSRTPLGGLFLPVYIERRMCREYTTETATADINALKTALAAESYEKAQQKLPENAEIVDKWTDFSMIESEEIIHARTVIEAETEIAVTRRYLEDY